MVELLVALWVALAADGPVVSPPAAPADHAEACSKARAALPRRIAAGAAVRALTPPDDPLWAATDVQHYRLELTVDPATHRLTGTLTATVRCVTDTAAFRFRLDDLFALGTTTVDGQPAAWSRIDPETVEVSLGAARQAGETFELAIPYDGFPTSQYGSIVFTSHNFQPIVYTLSQPWFAYTWWPAKDDIADKATVELLVNVPSTMVVASNGRLVGTSSAGGSRTFHWRTSYATAPYLVAFAATNYSTVETTTTIAGLTMPLNLYLYPEHDTPGNRSVWLQAVDMLGVFGALFGPYPFAEEKYGIYQFPPAGGMEHQTITGQGSFLEYLTAHELAHQWWGDLVTCATWRDIWLNEGFATYAEALWYEHKPGSPGEAWLHEAMELRMPASTDGTVYCYDDGSVSRIFSGSLSYRKAAWVLHMLRHLIGDDAFFATLTAWRAGYAFATATTADFQRTVEEASGQDLDWFFQQWVYGPGAPAYRYGWRPVAAAGRHYVEVLLEQVQSSSLPVFDMPVDIEVSAAGGDRTVVAHNHAREQYLLLPTDAAPDGVAVDPRRWVLRTALFASAFLPGPPRVVAAAPGPGSTAAPGTVQRVEVTFHDDVVAGPAAFTLTGARHGTLATAMEYDAASRTATLAVAPLAPDSYTLTVSDAVTSLAGVPLDGEILGDALPSGNGVAGGDAVLSFEVARAPRMRRIRPAAPAP